MDTETIREHARLLLEDSEHRVMAGDRVVGFDAALTASLQAGRLATNLALRRRVHVERRFDTTCLCAAILMTRHDRLTEDVFSACCNQAVEVTTRIADAFTGEPNDGETETPACCQAAACETGKGAGG